MLQKLMNSRLTDQELKELIIPHEKVAHVQLGNPLEHALLVLIKSGYSAIPVLDSSYKLHGQISKAHILDSLLGLERIELERLQEKNVEDVMDRKIPWVDSNAMFSKALAMCINHPFICIIDDDRSFAGILTRRSILVLINRNLRQHSKS